MKEVMEQYGKAVLCALVAVTLLAIVFGGLQAGEAKGLPAVLKAGADIQGVDYSNYKDGEQSAFVMEKERPRVQFDGAKLWTDCGYKTEDLFSAKDAEGNPAEVRILKIFDKDGQELTVTEGNIQFGSQGVYRILVKAVDGWCGTVEKEFLVPVRRR